MSNREQRVYANTLHLYLAFKRPKFNEKADCIRSVIKGHPKELEVFEAKLKVLGGNWRIHQTVNARDIEKARIWLIKHLLDEPKNACFIDSAWRTALLQSECRAENKFMLDVDTEDEEKLKALEKLIPVSTDKEWAKNYILTYDTLIDKIKSPHGWHYIVQPFDTREVCKLDYVTLLRDGYYFVKQIKEF